MPIVLPITRNLTFVEQPSDRKTLRGIAFLGGPFACGQRLA